MMNSLPRWFGRKKSKEVKSKSLLEISEPIGPVRASGLSAISQSVQSLNSLGSDCDNLYVNGLVPRGQFREYFLRPGEPRPAPQPVLVKPAGQPRPRDRTSFVFAKPALPVSGRVRRAASVHTTAAAAPLRKTVSAADVLEESGEEVGDAGGSSSYYNVGDWGAGARPVVLSQQNLHQHDLRYSDNLSLEQHMQRLTLEHRESMELHLSKLEQEVEEKVVEGPPLYENQQGRGRDPLSSSFLGHTLLSLPGDQTHLSSEPESPDSGAALGSSS